MCVALPTLLFAYLTPLCLHARTTGLYPSEIARTWWG